MKTISGVVREIERVKTYIKPDGVHRFSSRDGSMKGCRSVKLNDSLIMPRGMTGVYWRYREDAGIKVFYSFHHNRCCGLKTVKKQLKKHLALYETGFFVKPYKIVEVYLDFDYYGKDQTLHRHVKKKAYGIKVEHCFYPEKVWEKYAAGHAYDFAGIDQKKYSNHTPAGYLAFCKKLKKALIKKKLYICGDWPVKETENPKIGDVVFNMKKNQWVAVDVG